MTGSPTPRDLAHAIARLEVLPCPTPACREAAASSLAALRAALDDSLAGKDVDPGMIEAISSRFEEFMPAIEAASAGKRPELRARYASAFRRISEEKFASGLGEADAPTTVLGLRPRTLAVSAAALAAVVGFCILRKNNEA